MFLKLLITILFCCISTRQTKQIAGYYRSWKVYSTCTIEEINPALSTILIYAFAGINNNGTIEVLDYNADIQRSGYKNFNALKKQNSNLRTLLSIGGGNNSSEKFSYLAENEIATKTFIKSALEYIKKYGFDGIDIDWEFPSLLGGRTLDKKTFPKFLQQIRTEFDKHGYLLTVAVGPSESIIEKSYNVPAISKAVHYINLMAYNMHDYKNGRTGENAPLYSDNNLNVHYCTNAWILRGANPSKILLGIASYGRTFTLVNPKKNGIGDPVSGPGHPGLRTKAAGSLSYDEILENEQSGWIKKWSNKQQVPYLYKNNQWIGYDDTESVKHKVNFLNQNDLGGVVMWSVDMDDARGLCGTQFPLLKTINKHLGL